MAAGSVIVESTRILRVHLGHRRTSNPKDLLIRVAQSTYLARARSAPSSRRAQWATVIIVASTSTTGSACASVRAGASSCVRVGDAGAGDAGAGDAGADDAGAGDAGAGAGAGAGVEAGADVAHAFGDGARAGGLGVTSARHDERGANTPWYLTSGIRGGAIKAASRAMNSIGLMMRWVRPRRGVLSK
jgi:hypothetical protein